MLQELSITGFKSFMDTRVPLGPITLIVGTNASGKSNLRDALRFLHGVGLGYTLAEIFGEKYGVGGILQWRGIRGGVREVAYGPDRRFSVCCRIRGQDNRNLDYRITVDVSDERHGPRVVRESLSRSSRYIWDSHAGDDPPEQPGNHQIRVRHRRGGAYRAHGKVSDYSSARPVLSQYPTNEHESKYAREACSVVLDAFSRMRFLDLDPDTMRQPAHPGQLVLGDRGENLSSVLQGICADNPSKQTLLAWVRALTPLDAVDLVFKADFSGRILVHLVEAGGREISALSASDGTLRFLALAAALLGAETDRFYFFEEFDNGIHPTRLHLLLQLVQQICRQRDVQIVGTTHNPALLAFLDEEARSHSLLVYRNEPAGDSRIRRIAELPDIARVLEGRDLGRLHAAGWLEDAALFGDDADSEGEGNVQSLRPYRRPGL